MCAVLVWFTSSVCGCFFFFNDTATTEIYTLSLHDALPISARRRAARRAPRHARGVEGRLLGRAGRHPAPGRIRVGGARRGQDGRGPGTTPRRRRPRGRDREAPRDPGSDRAGARAPGRDAPRGERARPGVAGVRGVHARRAEPLQGALRRRASGGPLGRSDQGTDVLLHAPVARREGRHRASRAAAGKGVSREVAVNQERAMKRREFLKLGAIATGTFAVAGTLRTLTPVASAQSGSVPTVDRLVMTNVVDNIYDIFAKGGKLDTITVQRAALRFGADTLLAEHGLAHHLESVRGAEQRQVLLDFSLTERNLFNNYKVLKLDPAGADALIISHGHADHYGALPNYARLGQGRAKPRRTAYSEGGGTFCHPVRASARGTRDQGDLL